MQEESNPVKELLFEYIKNHEEKIQQLILQNRFDTIISEIIDNTYDKITSLGSKEETLATLATGILHYLLTSALIPSQRKISVKGIEVDIIIPDSKTLEIDPKKTLIIMIPKSNEPNEIQQMLAQMNAIQPIRENIWLVLSSESNFENRSFIIGKNISFTNIIFEISQFVNVNNQNKFKILKIN